MAHTCNPSTWAVKTRRIRSSRSPSATKQVSSQPGLHETLSPKEEMEDNTEGQEVEKGKSKHIEADALQEGQSFSLVLLTVRGLCM